MSSRERFALLCILLLGALVRIWPVITSSGPVGDGGLFFTIVSDIRQNDLQLPPRTTYNSLGIPLVYPPVALWLTAATGALTGLSTQTLIAWAPVIMAMASLGAFAYLSTRLLAPVPAILATACYALMPHAYDWLVAGGGITRAAGLTFSILAVAIAADRRGGLHRTVLAGGLLGLAGLSHPQAAVFGALGVTLVVADNSAWALRKVVTTAAVAVLVVLPWVVSIGIVHGFASLLAPGNRLEPLEGLIRAANLEFAGAPFMNVFVVPAALGLLVEVIAGRWRLPVLLLLTYLAGAGGGEFIASVPWAILGGIGGAAIVGLVSEPPGPVRPRGQALRVGAAATVLFLAVVGSLGSFADRSSKLQALGQERVDAMAWIDENTPESTRFLIPASEVWGDDEISEWFPAIAQRPSIGTVQGSEWLGASVFERQLRTHEEIRSCAGAVAGCYASIDRSAMLFIPKGRVAGPFSATDCCPALRSTLETSGYEIVYDGPGATIAKPSD